MKWETGQMNVNWKILMRKKEIGGWHFFNKKTNSLEEQIDVKRSWGCDLWTNIFCTVKKQHNCKSCVNQPWPSYVWSCVCVKWQSSPELSHKNIKQLQQLHQLQLHSHPHPKQHAQVHSRWDNYSMKHIQYFGLGWFIPVRFTRPQLQDSACLRSQRALQWSF